MADATLQRNGVLKQLRRLIRVQAIGRCRRAVQRTAIALRLWALPEENFFLTRALRLESRRHRPLLTIAGLLAVTVALNYAWWQYGMLALQSSREPYSPLHLPAALGGNAIGFAALLLAGISAFGIIWVCNARAAALLRSELFKSTLPQLQMLPIAEERWLWLMSAHPAGLALLIGLAGMPVYMLAVFTANWRPLDLLGLFLIFLMLGHIAPAWQPVLWRQTTKGGIRLDPKAVQAALRELNAGVDLSRMTPAQRMEHTRKVQRILAGLEGGVAAADPKPEEPVDKKTKRKNAAADRQALTESRGVQNPKQWKGFLWYIGFQFLFSGVFRGLRGAGTPLGAIADQIGKAFPPEVSGLVISAPISWPLILARAIWVPLPFLSFVLPPVVLLVPLVVSMRRQANLSLASHVSAAETFWTTRRLRHRTSFTRWNGFLAILLFFGYSWQTLVPNAEAVNLLPGALPTSENALAAMWTLALALGTLVAAWKTEAHFQAVARGELTLREGWARALRSACNTLGVAMLLYFGFCWFGGYNGGSSLWLARLLPTFITAVAFCAAVFGSGALQAMLEPPMKGVFKVVRFFWFWYLPLEAIIRAILGSGGLDLSKATHLLASPFVSLFMLFRLDLNDSGAPWWLGPLLQFFLAAGCLSVVLPQLSGAAVEAAGQPAVPLWQRLLDTLLLPLRRLWTFLASIRLRPLEILFAFLENVYNTIAGFFKRCGAQFVKWDEAILARGARYDNPVLTSELRSRVRRGRWSVQFLVAQLAAAGFLLIAGQPWTYLRGGWVPAGSPLPSAAWSMAVPTGLPLNPSWIMYGASITYVTLSVAWLMAAMVVNDIGRSFDRDRANGTLVFLFLTPMTNASIIIGKVLPSLILGCGLMAATSGPLLIGILISLAGGVLISTLVALFGSLFVLSVLCCATSLQTVFGVRTIKPGEGSVKGMLVSLMLQFAMLGALIWLLSLSSFDLVLLFFTLIAFTALNGVVCYVAARIALSSLQRQRNGDVTALGKGIA